MTTRRTMLDFPRNEAGLVDEFIGTAYDVVKGVYDALPQLDELYQEIGDIPQIAETAVEEAMVPARAEITAEVNKAQAWAEGTVPPNPNDPGSKSAKDWAAEAEISVGKVNKTNVQYPFTFIAGVAQYDVGVISGDPNANTTGLALWVQGAIDYGFTVDNAKQFTLHNIDAYADGVEMRIIINARFDDIISNFTGLQTGFAEEFNESQLERAEAYEDEVAVRTADYTGFLSGLNLELPVGYGPFLNMVRPTQTILRDGILYRPRAEYLTFQTSTWVVDEAKFTVANDVSLREELVAHGTEINGFERKPYTLNQGIKTAADYFQVHDVHLQEFEHFVTVDGDWGPAFYQAFSFGAAFPGPGAGGRLRLGGGRFNLKQEVVIPFGWTLIGNSADQFGTKCCPLPGFVGECMFRFTTPTLSYMNGTWDSICIDMLNTPGIHCMIFEGAYRNSAVKNCVFNNVAYNAAGLIVRPLVHVGAQAVCESFELSNFYVIKDQTDPAQQQTANGIQLYKVQETLLNNVKSFHASNPAPTRGGAAIYMEDCLGITITGGGVIGANQGIHIHAKTKNSTGITIIGMTWENNAVNDIKVTGENGFVCSTLLVPSMRREFPFSASTLDLSSLTLSELHIGTGSITAAASCNNTVIYSNGAGAKTIAAGAQITLIDTGNAVTPSVRMSPSLDIYSNNTPKVAWSVNGRSGKWDFRWNASDTVDNGLMLYSALNARILEITDTGTPLFRVTKRVNVKADNTAQVNFEITGRTGAWKWEWSADSVTENGFRAVSPEGATVLSAKTVAGAPNFGFFGGVMSPQRTVTGSRTSSDPILVSILNALAAHGLIINSTTP